MCIRDSNLFLSKIEGHGKINVNFKDLSAKLEIEEGERLFEGLLIGRPYYDAPHITSRICGVCPTSHMLASTKAIENAFDVRPSKTTILLRELLLTGQICQSHTLHLYFLAISDYLNLKSSLDLPEKNPDIFASGLRLKRIYDELIELVGGRAVHPLTPTIGGMTKLPTKNELFLIREKLEEILPKCEETIKLFTSFHYPEASREVEFMALKNDENYPYYDGIVWSSLGKGFLPTNYTEEIEEIVKPYSTAKFSLRKIGNKATTGFVTGPRARIAMFAEYLNPKALKNIEEYTGKIGPSNAFYNNIAQSFEILHYTEEAIKIIDELIIILESHHNIEFKPKAGSGTGVVEAPRGILYHHYEFDDYGNITKVDIITPTSQNLTSIEDDIEDILKHIHQIDQNKQQKIIEMLIRAFDPCITCSVH
jgi:coenzyme F420-reducing hydrogenase alpha subunit